MQSASHNNVACDSVFSLSANILLTCLVIHSLKGRLVMGTGVHLHILLEMYIWSMHIHMQISIYMYIVFQMFTFNLSFSLLYTVVGVSVTDWAYGKTTSWWRQCPVGKLWTPRYYALVFISNFLSLTYNVLNVGLSQLYKDLRIDILERGRQYDRTWRV